MKLSSLSYMFFFCIAASNANAMNEAELLADEILNDLKNLTTRQKDFERELRESISAIEGRHEILNRQERADEQAFQASMERLEQQVLTQQTRLENFRREMNEFDATNHSASTSVDEVNIRPNDVGTHTKKSFAQALQERCQAHPYAIGGTAAAATIIALNSKKGREFCSAASAKFDSSVNYIAARLRIKPETVKIVLASGGAASILAIAFKTATPETQEQIKSFMARHHKVLIAGSLGLSAATGAALAYHRSDAVQAKNKDFTPQVIE